MAEQTPRLTMTAMESYYFMHRPMELLEYLWGFKFPWTTQKRVELAWYVPMMTDCSGRSTAKTHNYFLIDCAKSICIPNRKTLVLGLDKKIGRELFEELIQHWIEDETPFARYVVPARGVGKAKVSSDDTTVRVKYTSRSEMYSFAADWQKKGINLQSHRVNAFHFNEWTSFPRIEDMEETVEPCATRPNPIAKATADFMRLTEGHLGHPLGLLTDEELYYKNRHDDEFIPRQEMKEATPIKSFAEVKRRFYHNFKLAYGFDYLEATKNDSYCLEPVRSQQDIIDFFQYFTDCDSAYDNQIVYDGSAKRPSDDSYQWIQYVARQIGVSAEEIGSQEVLMDFDMWTTSEKIQNHNYGYYSVSVDDVPKEYDRVIYNSNVVNKYRDSNLQEDFDRVYGGKWTEGNSINPYDPTEIKQCRVGKKGEDDRYYELLSKQIHPDKQYVMAIDIASGTEASVKGFGQIRKSSGKPGDDGCAAIFELGDTTPENPDKLVHIYVAESREKEPMAFDLQMLNRHFPGIVLMLMDTGGGGVEVAAHLKKDRLKKDGNIESFTPILTVDFNDDINVLGMKKLMFFSTGTQLLKSVHIQSDEEKVFWRMDYLNYQMHNKAANAIRNKTILFPTEYTIHEKATFYNNGTWTANQMEMIKNVDMALEQLKKVRYVTDRHGTIKKNTNGIPQYTAKGKKDLAYVIAYGLYFIWFIRELQSIDEGQEDDWVAMPVQ